jgi:hypothetical protein
MILAADIGKFQALAEYFGQRQIKAASIIKFVAIVVAEGLLIKVTKQMEWLNTDVGSAKPSLQERPEVFESVSVNLPVNVGQGVVDDLVGVFAGETLIGKQRITVKSGSSLDMLPDLALQDRLAPIFDNGSASLSASFQQSYDSGLILSASSGNAALALRDVHVPRLATYEGFVNLDFSGEFPQFHPARQAGCDAS